MISLGVSLHHFIEEGIEVDAIRLEIVVKREGDVRENVERQGVRGGDVRKQVLEIRVGLEVKAEKNEYSRC